MSQRVISTRFAIEGEDAVRAAVAKINSELKTCQSQLKLVESEYRGNANSMQALEAKAKALADTYAKQKEKLDKLKEGLSNAIKSQGDHAQKVAEAKDKVASLERQLEKLKGSTGDTTAEQARLTAELAKAKDELAYEEAALAGAERGVEQYKQQINSAQIGLNKLDDEVSKNKQYLDEAKSSVDGCASSIDKYGNEVQEAKEKSKDFGKTSLDSVNALAEAMAAAGVISGVKKIAEALRECCEAAISYESAFAGVKKTVEGTDSQLSQMSESIKRLTRNIPESAENIAHVAEAAGQLGIKTADIMAFTEVMVNLGVSTNMSADEAATALAKFSNITGMAAKDYSRLGSTVVDLGNHFATTEKDIVDMGRNIASAGKQCGLTEAEIMGMAAALSSVGLEAAAGGTSVSKMMKDMKLAVETGSDRLKQYAEVAGMTSAEFQALFGTKPTEAMAKFFQGLGSGSQSAIAALNEMGITEARQSDMILRLSGNTDIFTSAIETATSAWKANTALAEEAGKRYETTESKLQIFRNALTETKIAIGNVLNPALVDMASRGTSALQWAADFVGKHPNLVKAITAVALAAGILAGGIAVVVAAIKLWQIAQQALNSTMAADPIYLVVAAVAALAVAALMMASAEREASNETRDLIKAQHEAQGEFDSTARSIATQSASAESLIGTISRLIEKENKTAEEKRVIASLVDKLNATVPELAVAYDAEADALVDVNTGAKMSTASLITMAKAQAEAALKANEIARVTQLYIDQAEVVGKLAEVQGKLAEYEAYEAQCREHGTQMAQLAQKRMQELREEEAQLIGEQERLNGVIGDTERAYRDQAEATNSATDATGGAAEANTELISTYNDLVTQMDELQKKYDEAYEAAYKNITDTCGLFETLDSKATMSVSDMIKALDSQIAFMDTYQENMRRAVELGVDKGLVEKLSDGSEESARILQGIVDDGGAHVDELNEKLGKVEEGKESFSASVAAMQTDFQEKANKIKTDMDALVAKMNAADKAGANGRATMSAYISGLNSYYQSLVDTVTKINNAAGQIGNTSGVNGRHALGLTYVPFDGYIAELHKGERVLTASEAAAYIDHQTPVYYEEHRAQSTKTTRIDLGGIHVAVYGGNGTPAEADEYGKRIGQKVNRELRYRGVLNVG